MASIIIGGISDEDLGVICRKMYNIFQYLCNLNYQA